MDARQIISVGPGPLAQNGFYLGLVRVDVVGAAVADTDNSLACCLVTLMAIVWEIGSMGLPFTSVAVMVTEYIPVAVKTCATKAGLGPETTCVLPSPQSMLNVAMGAGSSPL